MVKECHGRTPSRVKAIIAGYIEEDKALKELLNYMYDPNTKFYYKISSEDFYHHTSDCYINPNLDLVDLIGILERLKNRSYGSNRERDAEVDDFLYNKSGVLAYFLYKTLDVGFGTKSAKDLGIIDSHSPQKGVLVKDYHTDVTYPCIADIKYNGIRLTAYCEYGDVEFKLLRGNTIEIPELKEAIKGMADVNTYALDGELIYGDGITEADRLIVSGRINEANNNKSGKKALDMTGLKFMMYDITPATNFHKGIPLEATYAVRRTVLTEKYAPANNNDLLGLAQQYLVSNGFDVDNLLSQIKALNGEGLMLKHTSSTYDFKKNKQWIKVKLIREADLVVVGYTPHTRNGAWIGSLECAGIIDGKEVRVNVGSGLNDLDRPMANLDLFMGKTVMVAYLDMVWNKATQTHSISNPRFLKPHTTTQLRDVMRDDKPLPVNY